VEKPTLNLTPSFLPTPLVLPYSWEMAEDEAFFSREEFKASLKSRREVFHIP